MGSDLLHLVRQVVDDAREAGMDESAQCGRAVAEVLLLRPELGLPEAMRVVEVARLA